MSLNPYDNFNYLSVDRWASYWHQIKAVSDLKPQRILEVGVGNHVVYDYFKQRDFDIVSLDIDPSTRPDLVASVEDLPFQNGEFDVVLCAEVLEHLTFEKFQTNVRELSRVAKKYIVLTLPHWGRHFSIDLRLPLIRRVRGQAKISYPPIRQHKNSPHLWEIGKRGTPLHKVKHCIQSEDLKIQSDYVLFEMPYHHLFVIEK